MSEDVRWVWVDGCGDPWSAEDLDDSLVPPPRPTYRRYCPECGQVVHVLQAEGQVVVPRHLVTNENGRYMTNCKVAHEPRILEIAP